MRGFQRVANANGGNRAATTPGYEASLAYVERRLARAGYETERHPFDFATWVQNGPGHVAARGSGRRMTAATDYSWSSEFSGSGNVTAPLHRDQRHPDPAAGRCRARGRADASATDWPAGDQPLAGRIALVQRGTCLFTQKIQLAKDLGAAGVLIFNDGFPGREAP